MNHLNDSAGTTPDDERAPEDAELLRRYAETGSEAAFAELVQRRIGLVYSIALRQTGGDRHRAQDATQAVFTDLARKARTLAQRPVLAGWLYRSAQFAAAGLVRAEQRRLAREQAAFTMETMLANDGTPADWEKVRPVLDQALTELEERDRDAILLRFFDARPFAEIGARLQLTENAARMRVERALDKLHGALARRGITSTTAALGAALGHQAAAANLPAGFAATVTGAALAQGTATAGSVAALFGLGKIQAGIAAVAAVAGATTYLMQAQANAELQREVAALRVPDAQVAALRRENQRLAATLAEVDVLRRDDTELKQLAQTVAEIEKTNQERTQRARQQTHEKSAQLEIDRMNREGNALVNEYKALTTRSKDLALSASERAEAEAAAKLKLTAIQARQREIQAYIASVRTSLPAFKAQTASERTAARAKVDGQVSVSSLSDTQASLHLPQVDHITMLSAYENIGKVKILRDPSLAAVRGRIDLNTGKVSRDEALLALRNALRDQLNVILEPTGDGNFIAKQGSAR